MIAQFISLLTGLMNRCFTYPAGACPWPFQLRHLSTTIAYEASMTKWTLRREVASRKSYVIYTSTHKEYVTGGRCIPRNRHSKKNTILRKEGLRRVLIVNLPCWEFLLRTHNNVSTVPTLQICLKVWQGLQLPVPLDRLLRPLTKPSNF